ncbi:hypothetical protein BC834DRAFT_907035 [Gloeopeniophorella convolvens]|nr:hypothetical protein BC834DRAFT_907035 [Gloeopeniophorella convolvens]
MNSTEVRRASRWGTVPSGSYWLGPTPGWTSGPEKVLPPPSRISDASAGSRSMSRRRLELLPGPNLFFHLALAPWGLIMIAIPVRRPWDSGLPSVYGSCSPVSASCRSSAPRLCVGSGVCIRVGAGTCEKLCGVLSYPAWGSLRLESLADDKRSRQAGVGEESVESSR